MITKSKRMGGHEHSRNQCAQIKYLYLYNPLASVDSQLFSKINICSLLLSNCINVFLSHQIQVPGFPAKIELTG